MSKIKCNANGYINGGVCGYVLVGGKYCGLSSDKDCLYQDRKLMTKQTNVDELLPCPCGEIPTALAITGNGQGGKWAECTGNCCGEWSVEFRTEYNPFGSKEITELAYEAWNNAPRQHDKSQRNDVIEERVKKLKHECELACMHWSDSMSGYQSEELMHFRDIVEKISIEALKNKG